MVRFESVERLVKQFVPADDFTIRRLREELDRRVHVVKVPQLDAYGWRGVAEVAGLVVMKIAGVGVTHIAPMLNFVKELAKVLDRGYKESAVRAVVNSILSKWVEKGLEGGQVLLVARFVVALANEDQSLEQLLHPDDSSARRPDRVLPDMSADDDQPPV